MMVGRIVGRGGMAIRQLRQSTGCEIGLERDDFGTYALIQAPTPEHAAAAEVMINERMLLDAIKLPAEDKFRLLGSVAPAQGFGELAGSKSPQVRK